jgi:uncharacterized protein YuzE
MAALKIPERPDAVAWAYDGEADVLYISVGELRPVLGVDLGEGVILRYDEARKEVTGLTLIGLRKRLLQGLAG